MAAPGYTQGEVLLAFLVFSDGEGAKRRPVLVVRDFGDADLLVTPVTSHPVRSTADVTLADWQQAGLKLPSTVRAGKLGTIAKFCVARKLGELSPADLAKFRQALTTVFEQILPGAAGRGQAVSS